ncbi:type I phosphomannose isomerase catalytic subunit [Stomatohabitans albus]|uniref:type I phosphomannose isomerase catalytic subunit n=1 Tax=Stomatohabitans albus TaxID=3110766 RepID=UPI00300C3DBA
MPILTLIPHFSERPWGGSALTAYGAPSGVPIGEAWVVAAHPNGVSVVESATGIGQETIGLGLDQVWENHRHVFGDLPGERFPLLTKIIDANDWLSLQLHPNDAQAPAGDLGKAECWYVIGAEPGAQLVHGITESDLEAAKIRILQSDFDGFFVYHDVHVGDFFDVPTGLVHGIGPGIQILETQQNSDTTYRLYDWDRPGLDGQLRPLHLQESADCVRTDVPHGTTTPTVSTQDGFERRHYVTNAHFGVDVWHVSGETTVERPHPQLIIVSVVSGSITIDDGDGPVSLVVGQSAVIGAHPEPLHLDGAGEVVVSWPVQ